MSVDTLFQRGGFLCQVIKVSAEASKWPSNLFHLVEVSPLFVGCWVTLVYLAFISLGMEIWDHHGYRRPFIPLVTICFLVCSSNVTSSVNIHVPSLRNITQQNLINRRGSNNSCKANTFMWNLLIFWWVTWWNIRFIGEGDTRSPLTLKPSHPTCYHIFLISHSDTLQQDPMHIMISLNTRI